MNNKLSNLLTFLKKDGVSFSYDKNHEFSNADDALTIFKGLMPNLICCYDTEVIDDINGYHSVIQSHIEVTHGEWAASNIQISGTTDEDITIMFLFNDKTVKWKFDQQGSDYVSDNFYKKLNNWTAKNLSGKFVNLPTNDQSIAFVYLPKNSANKVSSFVKNIISANEFIKYFTNDEDLPEIILNLKYDSKFDVNIRNSDGETALTAAIKAKNEIKTLFLLDEFEVDPIIKNQDGMSPIRLSRELVLPNVTEYLESSLTKKHQKWVNTEKLFGIGKDGLFGQMYELIIALKRAMNLDDMYHCDLCLHEIIFSRNKTFELGCNTLHVAPFFVVGSTEIHNTFSVSHHPKSGVCHVKSDVSLEETINLIRQFYNR